MIEWLSELERAPRGSVRLVFEGSDRLDPVQLAHFLFLFRGAYVLGLHGARERTPPARTRRAIKLDSDLHEPEGRDPVRLDTLSVVPLGQQILAQLVRSFPPDDRLRILERFPGLDPPALGLPTVRWWLRDQLEALGLGIGELFSEDLGRDGPVLGTFALTTRQITFESPLKVVFEGVVPALTLAVILSGGHIKIDVSGSSVDAEVPAIAVGIGQLRELFSAESCAPLDYGTRSRRVRLSKEELTELMRQNPTTAKRGGFQRMLVSMQIRINRTTRELELSENEMAQILRYGRTPKKGGWQTRIRKIFGSHFDLDDSPRPAIDRQ